MMDASLAPMLFVLVFSGTAVHSQITKGPANGLKKVGDSITMECVTRSGNCDQVDWVKMEGAQSPINVYRSGIGMLNGHAFPPERYFVSSAGGCNLTITQLKMNDSGRFSCALTVGDKEDKRSSILVVIGVIEACRSNVSSDALNQNDSYSFSTTISIPDKSVEPSNVILYFENKIVGETESMDRSQSHTVKTTLTGIARKENVTPHVCRASLPPNTADGFDRTTALLDVCTTQQLNVTVSFPVEDIAVSPSGPYYKGAAVRCSAKGYPFPTFKWTNLMSGAVVVDGDTLVIAGETGDKYNCAATNTVDGKATSRSVLIEVSSDRSYVGVIIGCLVALTIIAIIVSLVVCWFVAWCPLNKRLHSITDKKDINGEKENVSLNDTSTSNTPETSKSE